MKKDLRHPAQVFLLSIRSIPALEAAVSDFNIEKAVSGHFYNKLVSDAGYSPTNEKAAAHQLAAAPFSFRINPKDPYEKEGEMQVDLRDPAVREKLQLYAKLEDLPAETAAAEAADEVLPPIFYETADEAPPTPVARPAAPALVLPETMPADSGLAFLGLHKATDPRIKVMYTLPGDRGVLSVMVHEVIRNDLCISVISDSRYHGMRFVPWHTTDGETYRVHVPQYDIDVRARVFDLHLALGCLEIVLMGIEEDLLNAEA